MHWTLTLECRRHDTILGRLSHIKSKLGAHLSSFDRWFQGVAKRHSLLGKVSTNQCSENMRVEQAFRPAVQI